MPREAVNGVELHVEVLGGGPPLVLLHGFTGSARTWAPFLAGFGQRRRVVAVDLLGHGRSDAPPDPARYAMERCVEDLMALLDRLGLERVDLLGYSLGGRVALHLALAAAHRFRRLVLESASPGIADPRERRARQASDGELADWIERHGVAAFAERWEALPLFASQAALPEEVRARQRAERMDNRPRGLANSLRGMGQGAAPSAWGRLRELSMPVLLIAGALDARYCALAEAMQHELPAMELAVVPGAGHAVHLERPEAFARLVLGFLDR